MVGLAKRGRGAVWVRAGEVALQPRRRLALRAVGQRQAPGWASLQQLARFARVLLSGAALSVVACFAPQGAAVQARLARLGAAAVSVQARR